MTVGDFVFAARVSDVSEGRIFATLVDDVPVGLTIHKGELRAFGDVCTHDGGPLAEGTVMDTCVMCPRHGACFDLKTGHGTFPAAGPIPIYEARIEGDEIKIRL
jgi:nitrite reductase/ring-hydroxylating ferredoxin subunit